MATNNAHHSLAFVFNSSTFNNQSRSHRLRLVHHVLHHAYKIGATRLIKLCINHIESLNQLHCDDDDQPFTVPLTPVIGNRGTSDQHVLERSFHMVMGDTKLVTLIMRHIGLIHSSSKAIKGSTLLDNHKLSDYIKYGATEYLIQAYTSIKQSFPHNTTLLYEAFAKCNTIALDALLFNPNMSVYFDAGCLAEMSSSFSHPQWDRIVDEYIKFTYQYATPKWFQRDHFLSTVKHPAIVRKLMDFGVEFNQIEETYHIIDENWFTRPCALETLQFYLQHKILAPSILPPLMNECCMNGPMESFDMLMSIIDDTDQVYDDDDDDNNYHTEDWIIYFSDQFTKCGHLDIVKRLYSYLQRKDVDLTKLILRAIPCALEKGHLDVFNYLMDVLPSLIIGGGDKPSDDDDESADSVAKVANVGSVHHSNISIDLIKRLNSCPYIMFKANDDCLIQALKTGDTDLIEHLFMELIERKTNYNLGNSFKVAMEVGNVNIARKMIAMRPEMKVSGDHVLSLLKSLGGRDIARDDKVTESTIIEILRLSHGTYINVTNMVRAASNNSLSLIKLVVEHFNSVPENDVDRMSATDFRQSIDVCAKRCDIQSIDYLIDVAINVDGRNPQDEISTGVRYGWDQHRIHDIITLDVITNSSVLTYFMDKGYINVCDDNDKFNSNALTTIVNNACVSDNLDIIRTIYQRCLTPSQLQRCLPSMSSINKAVSNNHHRLICYMFEGDRDVDRVGSPSSSSLSPYVRAGINQRSINNLVKYIRHQACVDGCMNIINMCDRIIESINQ
ncbi:hypothetical protein SAMD00019534_092390 [Acytostelium subglobosum LB1]|uniref:hypothetical protein n=1 Tax=Acytostelium subglobosum LB1 TaxID=1410327 RepID=UPI0006450D34|nr:hypothetical protein SAMD00019534_092390 [Acytostelium subglobosum LB1]GAM26064.1 hypothetical protein SAMD00019534_092390 [Acytostelium subglobosum LB1]|eukprot:XP_012751107.1 hypothetical protein SAMD00019534_092390 [Acytostelium subglobosum LB1]